MHQSLRTDKDKRTPLQKALDKIKKDGTKPNQEQSDLDKWFEKIAREIAKKPFCWECGERIDPKYFKHATAHIFPKKTFPSVSCHPLNYVVAGASCGCHNNTHRWDLVQKMKIFPLILERMIMIEPDIAPDEIKNIPDFLLKYIEKHSNF